MNDDHSHVVVFDDPESPNEEYLRSYWSNLSLRGSHKVENGLVSGKYLQFD